MFCADSKIEIRKFQVSIISMAAVGQLLTQATQPRHLSTVSRHSEQSCFALMPKQASGFATFTFPLRSSKTNAGQIAIHVPQPSHNFRSICIFGISSSFTLLRKQLKNISSLGRIICLTYSGDGTVREESFVCLH